MTKTVEAADRFAFGENWTRFARLVDESRIAEAEASPRTMLATDNLQGRSFLDIGSGSGLFSLAAARLGGGRIHSFDDDAHSVSCTSAVRDQFLPTKQDWLVEECDITDDVYCTELRVFGIVYARGVLHHTGSLWHALENTCGLVKKGGLLFGSIYDQRRRSERWAENQAALQRRAGLVAQAVRSVRIRTRGAVDRGPETRTRALPVVPAFMAGARPMRHEPLARPPGRRRLPLRSREAGGDLSLSRSRVRVARARNSRRRTRLYEFVFARTTERPLPAKRA